MARESQQKVIRNRVPNKICKICGDGALGFNFGAVSCESCKAFFRRRANDNESLKFVFYSYFIIMLTEVKPSQRMVFRCPGDGNCLMTIVGRRQCGRCRLDKCVEVCFYIMESNIL